MKLLTTLSQSHISKVIQKLWKQSVTARWKHLHYLPTAYDTAWLSDLAINSQFGSSSITNSILTNQHKDGSWGSHYPILFDRIFSTIKTVSTLLANSSIKGVKTQLNQSFDWLETSLHRAIGKLNHANTITGIGSGVLLPPLLRELECRSGLDFQSDKLLKRWGNKISELNLSNLLKNPTHVAFSLEFLNGLKYIGREDLLNNLALERQLLGNGSILGSNSATAWYALQPDSQYKDLAINHLKNSLINSPEGQGVSIFGPMDAFNLLWGIYPLISVLGYIPRRYHQGLIELKGRLQPAGISMGRYFPFPDSDDTSVLLHFLNKTNLISKDSKFHQFYNFYDVEKRWFETYVGRHGSSSGRSINVKEKHDKRYTTSVNLHLYELFAKHEINTKHSKYVLEKLDKSFSSYFLSHQYFSHDRWHASPAYNNLHGIFVFAETRPDWAEQCLNYFLNTHNTETGLWGSLHERTAMELTSYGVLALTHYHTHVESLDLSILNKAISFLIEWDVENINSIAGLYISKTLYAAEFQADLPLAALVSYFKAITGEVPTL